MSLAVSLEESQAWITRRLDGLFPEDFVEGGARFFATTPIVPPEAFRPFWGIVVEDRADADLDVLRGVKCMVVFSNPFNDSELAWLTKLIGQADGLRHDVAMIWAPHTKVPEDRPQELCIDASRDAFVARLMEVGVDGILFDEPEGFQLAHMVGSRVHKSLAMTKMADEMVNDRQRRLQYARYLRECIQSTLWDYLRVRMAPTSIPAIDYNLQRGECPPLPGFTWGPLLGKGSFGVVYRISCHSPDGAQSQAIKAVSKEGITDLKDLRMLKRTIDVMQMLSLPEWRHRCIVELYQVYHSASHVFLRMEYGGIHNLHLRLIQRQRQNDPLPFPVEKVCSTIRQAAEAIVFLHLGPHICHRDIKPENYIIQETPDRINLKLADFDLAAVQERTTQFRTSCGTVPFAAPEVFGDTEYSGMCADIWSLGIVLIEIHCDVCTVEEVTGLKRVSPYGAQPDASTIRLIKEGFRVRGSAAAAAEAHCREELRAFLAAYTQRMIFHMVEFDTSIRWTASHVRAAIAELVPVESHSRHARSAPTATGPARSACSSRVGP